MYILLLNLIIVVSHNAQFLVDPVADLKNSQLRINELENLVSRFKSEIHNHQEEIADLNLCIESLELRVAHNQEESDALLREKEVWCFS